MATIEIPDPDNQKLFTPAIKAVAQLAARSAIAEAKALNIPVTYLEGKNIIEKYPDGQVKSNSNDFS